MHNPPTARLCASCDSDAPQRAAGLCHTCYGFHQQNGSLGAYSRLAAQPVGPPALDLEWMNQASCASVGGDSWFPEKGGSTREPKKLCLRCPVREACLAHALAAGLCDGVWGGLSPRQRRQLADAA